MSAAEMREALKPCPFCGAPAGKPRKITADERSGYQETVTISCGKGCGAIVGVNGSLNKSGWSDAAAGATEAAAIATWNSRALPDEEGMVEKMARAMCFAWHYAKPRTPDGEAEWARERSRLMAQARAALHVINGGAEGGEARQHIEALLSLHIAHHNNPIHGAARAFLSKREAK